MSLTLNMVGGGGGGLSSNDALLAVTVPTGSSVTASKGGAILTPTIWTKNADNTLDVAIFIIHQSQFDSVNAWTVTATDGTSTKSKTIIIDSADEYDITIVYRIYLIKNGVQQVEFYKSGGTLTDNEGTYCAFNSGGNVAVIARPQSAIDITDYSSLVFTLYDSSSRSWPTSNCPSCGVGSTAPTINSSSAVVSNYTSFQKFTMLTDGMIQQDTYTVDISSLVGQFYMAMACSGTSYYNGLLHISNAYFE